MKELHFLVSWNFLNIYVELLLKILLIGLFWKYPCKQKHVQSQRQKKKKNTGTTSLNVIRVSLLLVWNIFFKSATECVF